MIERVDEPADSRWTATVGSKIWESFPVPGSRFYHHFDRFAFVHGSIAFRHFVKPYGAIEDASGLDTSFEHVGEEFVDIGADRRRAATDAHVAVEQRTGVRDCLVMRDAD